MNIFLQVYANGNAIKICHIYFIVLGRSENRSQYRVKVPRAETIFLAIEESKGYQRRLLRSSRELVLNVMDLSGETAFIITKTLSCGYLPGFLHVSNILM
jgi:hypothetical protein